MIFQNKRNSSIYIRNNNSVFGCTRICYKRYQSIKRVLQSMKESNDWERNRYLRKYNIKYAFISFCICMCSRCPSDSPSYVIPRP